MEKEDEKSKIKEQKNIIIENENENEKNYKLACQTSKLQIEEETNQLINQIEELGKKYFYLEKIYKENNDINNITDIKLINLYNTYVNFFYEIFKTNYKFAKLNNKDFYHKIILLSKKIYINCIRYGIMNKIEYDKKKSLILISEFYDIIEVFECNLNENNDIKYKDFILPLLKNFKDCYDSQNSDENNAFVNIEQLFNLLNKNLKIIKKEILLNLLIKLLIKEKIKYNNNIINEKLINLILGKEGKNFIFLNKDIIPIPFIDEIFSDYIKDGNFEKNRYITKINTLCKEKKIFEEMVLFYLETKIMIQFNKQYNNQNEKNLFNDEQIKKNLAQYLEKLGKVSSLENNQIGGTIMKLYCIAYIKSFLYKLANFSFNHTQEINSIKEIVNDKIKNGNYNDKLKTSIQIYVLKLFFDNIGNYYEYNTFDFSKNEIDYNEDNDIKTIKTIMNQTTNQNELKLESEFLDKEYGFDFMIIPNKKNNKKKFVSVIKKLNNIKNNKDYDDLDLMNIFNNTTNDINIDIDENDNINENNDIDENNDINENNDCDIDLLYCSLLNVHFSFYYLPIYNFIENNSNNKFNNINEWILEKIEKKEFK